LAVLETAFGVLVKVAAGPVVDAARRQEVVIRTLKLLRLDPDRPPGDFRGLYAYAVVEALYGKPEPVLAFFRDRYVREAFERSFSTDDWSHLDREAEEAIRRNAETKEFGHLGNEIRAEFAGFRTVFHRLVDRSRTAAEARVESKVDQVADNLARLLEVMDREEERRQEREPGRASKTPVQRLAEDTRAWFDAVGYRVDAELTVDADAFIWVILVPARRGRFERVVVLGTAGELTTGHVSTLDSLVDRHDAVEGWGIAPRRVSRAAREKAAATDGRLACYTFDELIDQDADFEPYLAWLEGQIRELRIEERYVPPSARKGEFDTLTDARTADSVYDWRDGGLDGYVTSWLEDPSKEHLSLLGEFGMGKTWFTMHFAWELAKLWREAKRRGAPRPRLPIVVPLRDYAKAVSVKSLFSEFFFRKHEILPGGYSVFEQLNRMGRLLLIFDGFDEMAARVDRQAMVNNFWELASVVVPGAKVLLSCRTEHFPEDREGRNLLGAKLGSATEPTDEVPQFEVVELMPFDDDQVALMLGHLTDDDTVGVITGNPTLLDLMRRPVMSELVLDALPAIEAGAPVDLARVYLYAVRRKLDRDVRAERTFTSIADKLYFMCELAWEMVSSDTLSINYRQFPDRLRACFGSTVELAKDLDHWQHDMRGQTLLIRNADGDYAPAHKSMLEFFVAFKLAAQLGVLAGEFLEPVSPVEGAPAFRWSEYFLQVRVDGGLPPMSGFAAEPVERLATVVGNTMPTRPITEFLRSIVKDCPDRVERLLAVVRSTRGVPPDAAGLVGGLGLGLVGDGEAIAGADLSGTNLAGLNVADHLVVSSLESADLRRADLRRALRVPVRLVGADLREAVLAGEAVMASGMSASAVVALPAGGIVAQLPRSVQVWDDGDLGGPGRVIPRGFELRRGSVRALDAERLFGSEQGGVQVIEIRTGARLGHLSCRDVVAAMWRERPVLLMAPLDAVGRLDILDRSSLEPIGWLAPPTTRRGQLGRAADLGVFFLTTARLWRLTTDMTWDPVSTLKPLGSTTFAEEVSRVRQTGETEAFMELALASIRLPTLLDRWLTRNLFERAGYSARARRLAIADKEGIRVWSADDPKTPQWSRRVPTGVRRLAIDPGGEFVVTSSPSGELAKLDLATGELRSRRTFNENLVGARFSRDSLADHVIDGLELAGAIVED
jgi:hypothetical protein